MALLVVLGLAGAARSYLRALDAELPDLTDSAGHGQAVRRLPLAFPSIVYAADGQELARYFRQNRTWVALDRVSPHVTSALLAVEDHRFYEHGGIDAVRLVAVAWQTLRLPRDGRPQGASTISMQLARNLFEEVGRERSLRRKLKEMRMAQRLEARYTKGEILELYLNTVPFGMGAFGIEAAAQTYFGKSAAMLDVGEAAVLIGLLKGTTHYGPARHPERARHRRDVVLGQMLRHGALSPADYARFLAEPIRLALQRPARIGSLAPHFAEHVRTSVEAWAEANGHDLYTDGLRIHTTLDASLQASAVAALSEQVEGLQAVAAYEWSRPRLAFLADTFALYQRRMASGKVRPFAHFWQAHPRKLERLLRRTSRYRRTTARGVPADSALAVLQADGAFIDSLQAASTRLEAGLVALDPTTGQVKAWVGGRDFGQDQYDKVAMARRQPGSTFKPFVYAAAVEAGWRPEALVYDTTRGRTAWRPRDLAGTATDSLTVRDALAFSKNTAAARLIADVGPGAVARLARQMGI
ncbi:MAG: transglycosylase domain-containing protein, partial [Rhodothermales bacterium]